MIIQNYYIAIDFDGTLTQGNNFPEIGMPHYDNINKINDIITKVKSMGYNPKLILWTCRADWDNSEEHQYLTKAVNWCTMNLPFKFDYINQNPELDFGNPSKVKKIMADLYIDDKSFNPLTCEVLKCLL